MEQLSSCVLGGSRVFLQIGITFKNDTVPSNKQDKIVSMWLLTKAWRPWAEGGVVRRGRDEV